MRKFAYLSASIVSLISAASVAPAAPFEPVPKRVAILLFDSAEIIDFSGPYEVFGGAGYQVFTVGRTKASITTAMGMKVVPKYDFSDVPDADILLVPGGSVEDVRKDQKTLSWIRKEAAQDQHTMSVCNGSLILADAGLLDGLTATATFSWIPRLRAQYPKVHVVDDKRWVDNGKIITTAGLSAGIDGALHLVEVMEGRGRAETVALHLEYNWQPEGGFVRAALADVQIPKIDVDSIGRWRLLDTNGNRDRWVMRVEGTSPRSDTEISDYVSQGFMKQGHWTLISSARGRSLSNWRFADQDGKAWRGTLSVISVKNAVGHYTMDISVERGS